MASAGASVLPLAYHRHDPSMIACFKCSSHARSFIPYRSRCFTGKNHGLTLPTMSGFWSSDAEAALMGEEEDARRLFYQNHPNNPNSARGTSGSSYQQQQWPQDLSPVMTSTHSQAQTLMPPTQYVSWPSSQFPPLQQNDYGAMQYQTTPTLIVPSTPYPAEQWPNAPWPTLHPDDMETPSDASRSVSPNPSDLHNFGIPLGDGRSWRCAHPNCSSQAVFTRGCDLRKHFRRHNKSLFCRREDCPQSKEGGFSSRKDRDRHESRHAPSISCSEKGCGRVFSRVDNMKDHVRRIHQQKS